MSSKVKGCLACENAGSDRKSEKRKTKENAKRRMTTSAEQKSVALSNAYVAPDAFVRAGERSEPGFAENLSACEASRRGADECVRRYVSSSSMAVISDCACVLPVRTADEIPSTSQRLASSTRLAVASVCAAIK